MGYKISIVVDNKEIFMDYSECDLVKKVTLLLLVVDLSNPWDAC